jgi:hypothetical protein
MYTIIKSLLRFLCSNYDCIFLEALEFHYFLFGDYISFFLFEFNTIEIFRMIANPFDYLCHIL